MTTLFTTGNKVSGNDYDLLLEYGPDYCTYGYWNKAGNSFDGITYHSFSPFEDKEAGAELLEELKSGHFNRVIFSSGYHNAVLLPQKYTDKGAAILQAMYTDTAVQYLHDAVAQWQLGVGYTIPQAVYNLVQEAFPAARYMHAYTAIIKAANAVADSIDVCFSPAHFRVLVKKQTGIQLAQTYSYSTPLDVIYFLLKICYEFELDQQKVDVVVSGLIDKDSAMYSELYTYFLNLYFVHQRFMLPDATHPQHYFASLYNVAVCAS